MQVKTVKIKSSHPESQGDYVEINETDFDPQTMQLYEQAADVVKKRKPKNG